jgi:hypothetical protein
MHSRLKFAAACAIGVILHTSTANATHPHERNGFMIGFGVGGGSFAFEDLDGDGGGVGNFRLGYALNPAWVIHLETNAWRKTSEEAATFAGITFVGDVTVTAANAVAAATFYPPPANGLFLRGGFGFARVDFEVEGLGVTISDHESGWSLLGALGYEWRLTKMFALAPQVEFTYQDLDTLRSSTLYAGGLGFNWYW